MTRWNLALRTLLWAALAAMAVGGGPAVADDLEIFRTQLYNASSRPKVLIIFDTSGSMGDRITIPKPAYDPKTTYPQVAGITANQLYWSTTATPPASSSTQRFNAGGNRCASSLEALNNAGTFQDQFAAWRQTYVSRRVGWRWGWNPLMAGDYSPSHVDCALDVRTRNGGNNAGAGSPGDGWFPQASTTSPYSRTYSNGVGQSWTRYWIFTSNYMNWHHSSELVTRQVTKLSIAQTVVTNIVEANPSIDFGLAVFNYNARRSNSDPSEHHGGRIVRHIKSGDRDGLLSVIKGSVAGGSTPLCETTYEVYRYLTAQSVYFGDDDSAAKPRLDTAEASAGGKYKSPIGACQNVYVILMTDGEPQYDTSANDAIKALIAPLTKLPPDQDRLNPNCSKYRDAYGANVENCLPELAHYMAHQTTDLDKDPTNGQQRAFTYTIGFTTNQALLLDTATRGGGEYFMAANASELTSAFQGAIASILARASTFTSPALAVNSASRTESRDAVYFAMFKPANGTDWPGNLKKLTAAVQNGSLVLKDAGKAVQDVLAEVDRVGVDTGGFGEMLQRQLVARSPNDGRVIWTNGSDNLPVDVSDSSLTALSFGLPATTSANELSVLKDWIRGWQDRSADKKRWILGDIIHSRPQVLDYGPAEKPKLRVVVGTNAGFLHMFDDTLGEGKEREEWAFIPRQLLSILPKRRANSAGADKIYGVDSPIAVYRHDANKNGVISATDQASSADKDRMVIYFGLRRGGRVYVALDVTDPAKPFVLWQIDGDAEDDGSPLSELGQTWSVPVVTRIPDPSGTSGQSIPVVIFGGGYDPLYDSASSTSSEVAAAEGRGVFIVHALTGKLVWSATGSGSSGSVVVEEMRHPIPASVAVVDSNGDGLTDRIYAPDLGGNVWRIDLLPPSPKESVLTVYVTKLAELAGDGPPGDRRFFNAIDVVRTSAGKVPFDALLLGSGDRTNPNARDNVDRFYMLRDRQVTPFTTAAPKDCSDSSQWDVRCIWPITDAGLFDVTLNPAQDGNGVEQARKALLVLSVDPRNDSNFGWKLTLEDLGEKSLSKSVTVAGRVMFSTYSPTGAGEVSDTPCVSLLGTARQYVIGLQDARAVLDLYAVNGTALSKLDRVQTFSSMIPDTPAMFHAKDGSIHGIRSDGKSLRLPARLQRVRTYWYELER